MRGPAQENVYIKVNLAYMFFLDIWYSFGGPEPFRISGLLALYRFLGVFLEENINFNRHIQFVINKVSNLVFILYNFRSFLDSKVLLLTYYTLVYPNFIYNITVSGAAAAMRLYPLNVCLNKNVRTNKIDRRRVYATPLYVSLELLKLRNINDYAIGNYTFNSTRYSTHPNTISFRYFTYNTRASEPQLLEIPVALSSHSKQSISIAGLVTYNYISNRV